MSLLVRRIFFSWILLLYPGALFATPTPIELSFRFFDEKGRELEPAAVIRRMSPGGRSQLSEGAVDLDTFKTLSLNPSDKRKASWTTPLDLSQSPRQGWMVHWNTVNTGYSTFLLDNQGAGFSRSQSLIFNERLALDAKHQLEDALKRRPGYSPSQKFTELQTQIRACFTRLSSAQTDSARGMTGQACLDLVALAMTQLLREYGLQQARTLGNQARWGVTIDPDLDLPFSSTLQRLNDLADLFAPQHRWARIIMLGRGSDELEQIRQILTQADALGIRTLGQLFDSDSQKKLSFDAFRERVDATLSHPGLDRFTAWEIGNEVNGSWLGEQMTRKIEYAASEVKRRYPGKETCLTFYWTAMHDSVESSLFNWIERNITPALRSRVDCITLSVYTDHQPLNFLWDSVMHRLSKEFPGKRIMLGETGYGRQNQPLLYPEGPSGLSLAEAARLFVSNRYPSAFSTENSVGGGFWWYFEKEMMGKKPLWHALRETYCSAYPELCQAIVTRESR